MYYGYVSKERLHKMNNNLRPEVLSYKNKDQLLQMFREAVNYAEDENTTDALHEAIQQIQAVAYVLASCDYEGKE